MLQDIASWLRETYEGDSKLTGIIYLHGINNPRMTGSALRNLRLFRELCGADPLKNVVLSTTFWDEVETATSERREVELRETDEFWAGMLKRGSRMARAGDRAACIAIVTSILGQTPQPLQIQRELVEDDVPLVETAAGSFLNEELATMETKHKLEKAELQKQLEEALQQHDIELQEIMKKEQDKVDEKLTKVKKQQEQLRADRRSDMRRQQMHFDDILWGLRANNAQLEARLRGRDLERQNDQAQFQRQFKAYRQYNEDAWRRWYDLSVEDIIAKVRVEEGKLRAEEREQLETAIENLQKHDVDYAQKPESGWKPKAKKAGAIFITLLQAVVPFASLLTLGLPLGGQ